MPFLFRILTSGLSYQNSPPFRTLLSLPNHFIFIFFIFFYSSRFDKWLYPDPTNQHNYQKTGTVGDHEGEVLGEAVVELVEDRNNIVEDGDEFDEDYSDEMEDGGDFGKDCYELGDNVEFDDEEEGVKDHEEFEEDDDHGDDHGDDNGQEISFGQITRLAAVDCSDDDDNDDGHHVGFIHLV